MKLFLVRRAEHDDIGYDEYDSVVVVAADEQQARETHPNHYNEWCSETEHWFMRYDDGHLADRHDESGAWTNDITTLQVELLGNYLGPVGDKRPGVVMASFNAG